MSQNWSVMINGSNPASFDPDVFGTDPGKPLKAMLGDLVSWNNQTNDRHQIKVVDSKGNPIFLTAPIEPFKPSMPGYVPQKGNDEGTGTISYICTKHENEKGKITVVAS